MKLTDGKDVNERGTKASVNLRASDTFLRKLYERVIFLLDAYTVRNLHNLGGDQAGGKFRRHQIRSQ